MLKGTRVNLFCETLFVWPGLSFYPATDLFTCDWVDNPIWVHPDRCITGSKLNSPFIDVIGNKNKDLKREEQSVCGLSGKNTTGPKKVLHCFYSTSSWCNCCCCLVGTGVGNLSCQNSGLLQNSQIFIILSSRNIQSPKKASEPMKGFSFTFTQYRAESFSWI